VADTFVLEMIKETFDRTATSWVISTLK